MTLKSHQNKTGSFLSHACIVEAAEEAIGRRKQKQLDWFEESMDTLVPLIDATDEAHKKAIQTNSAADKEEFRRQQKVVKRQ